MTFKSKHIALSDKELACFRTTLCEANQSGNCKDSDRCPYSHCLTWQRRNPFEISYAPKLCPDIQFVRKGSKMSLVRRCNRGRHCQFAHSKEEELYHPMTYKTKLCSIAPTCTRFFCPFAHSAEEVRCRTKIRLSKPPENEDVSASRQYAPNFEARQRFVDLSSSDYLSFCSHPFHRSRMPSQFDNQSWSEGSTASTCPIRGAESLSSESLTSSPSLQSKIPNVESTLMQVACALLSSSTTVTNADDRDDCVSSSSVIDVCAEARQSMNESFLPFQSWNPAEHFEPDTSNGLQLVVDLAASIANCFNQGRMCLAQLCQHCDVTANSRVFTDLNLTMDKSSHNCEHPAFDEDVAPFDVWNNQTQYRTADSMSSTHSTGQPSNTIDHASQQTFDWSVSSPDFFHLSSSAPKSFPIVNNSGFLKPMHRESLHTRSSDYERLWLEISDWCETGRGQLA